MRVEWLNGFMKAEPSDLYSFFVDILLGQVIRKVIRRVSTPTPENQRSDRYHRGLHNSPILQEEVGMKIPSISVFLGRAYNLFGTWLSFCQKTS